MKKEIKEISIYMGDTVLRENIAPYESVRANKIEINKIVKIEDVYAVDYTTQRPNGDVKRTGFTIEPLELIEMINTKINNFIEKYESIDNE